MGSRDVDSSPSLPDLNRDRVATIIHRGRDHGLPTYAQVRKSCGFAPAQNFQDLNNTISQTNIDLLRRHYDVS